jgi:hypothetical protein
MASLLQNPLVKGTAMRAAVPSAKVQKVMGSFLRSPAHLPDVLLVMAGVDHRTGAEEEEGLEEGVGVEVEHAGIAAAGSDALRHHHVAELGEGRVGEDALDVVLLESHQGGEQRGDRADPGDGCMGRELRRIDEEAHAGEHEDPGRDHRRGVDQGGDGRGPFHRVGQPDVQRHLGGLADRTAENAKDRYVEQLHVDATDGLGDLVEVDRLGENPDEENPDHETEVADAVDEEGLLRRVGGRGFVIPVTDEDVRADPDEFPEDEHHREIVREDDAGHREEEERKAREVARLALVVLHVTEREEVHEETDRADDQHHPAAETIDLETDAEFEGLAEVDPRISLRFHRGLPAPGKEKTKDQTEQRRTRREERGQAGPAFQAKQDRRRDEQRKKKDGPGQSVGIHWKKTFAVSVFHRVDLRHIGRLLRAEEGDDDGETDGDLGRRHGDDEEKEDVGVVGGLALDEIEARKGDEGEVRRREHELEAHEDDEEIAPHEHAGQPDRKERAAHEEEMIEGEFHVAFLVLRSPYLSSFLLSTTTPTVAARRRTPTIWTGNQ